MDSVCYKNGEEEDEAVWVMSWGEMWEDSEDIRGGHHLNTLYPWMKYHRINKLIKKSYINIK